MSTAYIALGSNLGKRQTAIRTAIARIAHLPNTQLTRLATLRATAPVDAPPPPPHSPTFINTAAAIETRLSPGDLLQHLLQIERDLGRQRLASAVKNAPRIIDLDLLLYDNLVFNLPGLTLPHPRLHLRRFVLEPLAEIAPDLLHPTLHQTIQQLLFALPAIAEPATTESHP